MAISKMKIDRSDNIFLRNRYFGIGMEKLDRDAYDPEEVYDHVARLGVKWVRIQSGWAKTEKQKGIYDHSWLDAIVDNLVRRDLTPWICFCYGNPLYDERAKKICGGVGCPPIGSEESLKAWLAYCREVAARYKGKVEYYEIWNEPEWLWGGKTDPEGYTEFCKVTARAVKEGNDGAKIIVGSVASIDPGYMLTCLNKGIGEVADALSYHAYTYDEKTFSDLNRFYNETCNQMGKPLEIIHGESGSQSKNGGNGAFKGFPTDPIKQAKHLLRQMTADRLSGAFFSSYFTAADMHEDLEAVAGRPIKKHGYFGVLSCSFDDKGIACAPFVPKPSYYAFQNVCAFFSEDVRTAPMPFWIEKKKDAKRYDLFSVFSETRKKRIGGKWRDLRLDRLKTETLQKGDAKALVYWESTDLLNDKTFFGEIRILIKEKREPKLVNLLNGEVVAVEYDKEGEWLKATLPVRDYPMALTFGDFIKTV